MKTNAFFAEAKAALEERLRDIQQYTDDRLGMSAEFAQESMSELSNYDNHPADNGTELYEREKDLALEQHADREQARIKKALQAIADGTYGTCEKCGKDIPLERLRSEPAALQCVHHAYQDNDPDDRPSEEDRLIPGKGGFTDVPEDDIENERFDAEESWELAAAYGTSDTPSDTFNPSEVYEGMFGDGESGSGKEEVFEGYTMLDDEGRPIHFDRDIDYSEYFLRR
ncbi:TraR/DksA C4-type zinc finger protein [Alteribacillus iranensis]|uniref:Regulatory protein, yteA family n=1 Tax=Alteribacillus iranensis TaxID=930128 RepID=A0A1I2C2Z0_9BACI|nr:TraR/DksA C4-type zinc finger protein [Alteribacillus iranensis]SFE62538.1 regulatory protein, yteA family [Alteribacillus iranensis]